MGLFKSIGHFFKKVVHKIGDVIKGVFHGDPLSILATAAMAYGGYSLLANTGITTAGAAAADIATETGTGMTSAGMASSGLATGAVSAPTGMSVATGADLAAGGISSGGLMSAPVSSIMGAASSIPATTTAITGTNTGKGLLGSIGDWWQGLDSKGKLQAAGMGLKMIGNYAQGDMAEKMWKDKIKYGAGYYMPNTTKVGSKHRLEVRQDMSKEYVNTYKTLKQKAENWIVQDDSMSKRLQVIQNKMQDPEYRRGFTTIASLLANPVNQNILQTDPTSSMWS